MPEWKNNRYVDAIKNMFAQQKKPDFKYNSINDRPSNQTDSIDENPITPSYGVVNPNNMNGPIAPGQPDAPGAYSGGSITDFDMNDPESVKALQIKLGVKADGMFGPKTEEAYRMAVDSERKNSGQESLEYDYNDQVQSEKKFQPFGGMLRRAYSDFDEKHMGGKLPGGYKDSDVMTAEEFYNK